MRFNRALPASLVTALALVLPAGCGEPSRYGTLPDAAGGMPEFAFLPSGLDVDASPPSGWTDVVVKLVPVLSVSGTSVPADEREASSFRTVILADVTRPGLTGGAYELKRVGVGLSLPIKGRDTVVTMGTREQLGVGISRVSKFALHALEEAHHQTTLLAGNSTFALIGVRSRLKAGGAFHKVQLRFAIAVDPKTGAIRRALWPVENDKPGASMSVLTGDPAIECPMTVVLEKSLGVVPKGVSFGLNELPKGRVQPIPAGLAPLAGLGEYTPDQVTAIERAFRDAVDPPAPVTSAATGSRRGVPGREGTRPRAALARLDASPRGPLTRAAPIPGSDGVGRVR